MTTGIIVGLLVVSGITLAILGVRKTLSEPTGNNRRSRRKR